MLVSNFLFDLYYFYNFGNPESGFLSYFSRIVAGLFLFVVGISLTLSIPEKNTHNFKKNLKRSLKLLFVALCISVATYLAVGDNYIVFGILHLIALSVILGYFFLGHPWISLVTGIIVIPLGSYLQNFKIGSTSLLWLGIQPEGFSSVDYTPLIPWFGCVLIGIFFGHLFYAKRKSRFEHLDIDKTMAVKGMCFLGKKSLLIYCIHQPVFWAALLLFNAIV